MRLPARSAGARVGARAPRPALPSGLISRLRCRFREEQGFTIVEVIVATLVLVVGLLTAYLMLAVAVHSSSDVREREEGVSLARQVTEDARSIPYSQLSNATIATQLQAYPGLANSGTGSTWTIVRAGYTYTLVPSLTNINDPKDTSGATDIKQFSVTVSWNTYQGNTHTYTETATISSAGQDPGLQASNLCLVTSAAGITGPSSPCNNAPVVTSSGITSLQFSVTAPTGTQAIVWTLNGVKQPGWIGSTPSSGTTWTSSSWSLSGVSDGNYTVGAAAEDSNGIDGPAVTIPVRLIRNVPSAPTVTGDGFNSNLPGWSSTVAEIKWNANPELNVVGYDVYNGTTKICQTSLTTAYATCGTSAWCTGPTACIYMPSGGVSTTSNLAYTVYPLYYDATNTLKEGNPTNITLTSGTPTPPSPPTVAATAVSSQLDGTAIITWTPPVGGTPVSFYRIYRDGTSYTSRWDTVDASTCSLTCTYHDVNRSQAHSYYISAVGGTTPGSNMAESTQVFAGSG